MEYYAIDCIGPFFLEPKGTVNWSKIPFFELERDIERNMNKVVRQFTTYLSRIRDIGYNTLTLDDLAHMVTFPFYDEQTKSKIEVYKEYYSRLIRMAKDAGMYVFINSDVMFNNPSIEQHTGGESKELHSLLKIAVKKVCNEYPIDGINLRIGESDGIDVKGDFHSTLTLRTAKEANVLLKELLLVVEEAEKELIFRTWTVGAYEIGDLIWNKRTFDKVFQGIRSDHLIVSMKYGDTDFFSNLELNPLFFHNPELRMMIELQTRRERDGFGTNPYFVGWDYFKYKEKLENMHNLVGLSVWCQTGGWSKYNDITFLKNSSPWNELNTIAALRIFKDHALPEQIIRQTMGKDMVAFLREYNSLYHRLIYSGGKPFYFRRSRVPPVVWMFWDNVTISPFIKAYYQVAFKSSPQIDEGEFLTLRTLGAQAGIEQIDFLTETLKLFYELRKVLARQTSEKSLIENIATYQERFSGFYTFTIDMNQKSTWLKKMILMLILRKQSAYRLIDKLFFVTLATPLFRLMAWKYRRDLPEFIDNKAMHLNLLLT
ncbi:hypothetical protein H6504_04920 [Candidatus Woesearchaeota archaeon]|nr:hypothetical protein [Candidatus Woesearchaeota archaeon]